MATIEPVITPINSLSILITWPNMAPGDDGGYVEVASWQYRMLSASPVGSITNLTFESSNDQLVQANVQTVTATPTEVTNRGRYLRPNWLGSTGGTADVVLYCVQVA